MKNLVSFRKKVFSMFGPNVGIIPMMLLVGLTMLKISFEDNLIIPLIFGLIFTLGSIITLIFLRVKYKNKA